MLWYEYMIAFVAIFLVILPIILKNIKKKKGKSSCGCGCESCSKDCPLKRQEK